MSPIATQTTATVLDRFPLADENYRLRLHCPQLAAQVKPGQFFMLRAGDRSDPLLGRPFALYDTVADANGDVTSIDIGIHTVGKMTALLEQIAVGSELEIWGPLGNGFPAIQAKRIIQVAGGIGYTPFVAVSLEALTGKRYGVPAREPGAAEQMQLIYGVRSANLLADLSDWATMPGLEVSLCTEDGTAGHHGLVTELLEPQLSATGGDKPVVLTCGPLRMMRAVAELCIRHDVECWASLETPMACGYGACFSCVVPIKDESSEPGWDYQRSCVEGPVFRGSEIVWDQF